MTAMALLLVAIGALLIHAAITGKSLAELLRNASGLKAGEQPKLGGL